MSPEPFITVCTPVFNLEQYVGETLKSLVEQTFTDFEVLVIDDGSTDGSAKMVEPFLSDPRFNYVYQDNAGVGAARNRALELARGLWFAPLDGDDVYYPCALETLAALARSDSRANLVYGDVVVFAEGGVDCRAFGDQEMPEGNIARWLYARPRFGTLLMMARTDDLKAIGGYDTSLPAMEDYELWMRFAHQRVWARSSREVIGRYRVRGRSKTSNVLRNTRLMLQIVQAAIERETRPELVKTLEACARFHQSRYQLLQARAKLRRGDPDVEYHLWKSFGCDRKQKRVLLSALMLTSSRLTRIPFGRKAVVRLLDGASRLPWDPCFDESDDTSCKKS